MLNWWLSHGQADSDLRVCYTTQASVFITRHYGKRPVRPIFHVGLRWGFSCSQEDSRCRSVIPAIRNANVVGVISPPASDARA